MEKVKVLIIGAGPAGSTCALLLKKQNVDCLLIDRAVFPRDKICGGGLTPRSCQLLNSLLPTFHYDYNSVNRLKLLVEGKQVFDLHMKQELRIVKRREFDAQLLQEYQNSGGAFANDALDLIEEKDGQIIVTLKSGRQVACVDRSRPTMPLSSTSRRLTSRAIITVSPTKPATCRALATGTPRPSGSVRYSTRWAVPT